MKTIAEYANQLNALVRELQAEMAQIKADGVLEYEEYLSSQKFYANYQAALKNLKKEVSLDMKQVRDQYKGAILLAKNQYAGKEQTEQVKALQLEQHEALRPYEQVLQTIDRLMLGADSDKQKLEQFAEDFKRLQVAAIPLRPDAEAAARALAEAKKAQQEDTISRDELSDLLKKWRFLLDDVNHKLSGDQDPLHAAVLKGAKRSLELAISDLSSLIEE